MKKIALFLAVLLVVATATACSAASTKQSSGESSTGSPGFGVSPPFQTAPTVAGRVTVPSPSPGQAPSKDASAPAVTDTERKIVRTGNLSLVVEDVARVIDEVTRIADNARGFVISSQSFLVGKSLRGTISIRVPAEGFANAMSAISLLAVEVVSETTDSQDVTEEFTDLQARLRNLEATEKQLLAIMNRAEKVEDVLAVQRELTNTRSQIEQIKGRIQLLERTTSTSLIYVTLEQSRLEVRFNATQVAVRAGQQVQFIPDVSGGFAPYSYEWDFGDKETSNNIAPTHGYRSAGEYKVTLKVTDDRANSATETREDYITVTGGWNPGSVTRAAWRGLQVFAQVLGNIVLTLAIWSPVWVIVLVAVWWFWWRRRKKAK